MFLYTFNFTEILVFEINYRVGYQKMHRSTHYLIRILKKLKFYFIDQFWNFQNSHFDFRVERHGYEKTKNM